MKKIRASKCEIREVSPIEEKAFLNGNHYQGYIPSIWCKGLYLENQLVCLMSFGRPRYNSKYDWELLRLCTLKDCTVYGGASRLLKCFTGETTGSIISYCNRDKFTGDVYKKLGFTSLGICKSYYYTKNGIKWHRSAFTKKNCLKKWPQYIGQDITEAKIMQEQGFTRVSVDQETFVYGVEWYIYQIENKINGKTYIGQHLDRGDKYMGSGSMLWRAYNKYGIENFEKTILESHITSPKEADRLEKLYISKAREIGKAEYNITDGGQTYHPSKRPIYYRDLNAEYIDRCRKLFYAGGRQIRPKFSPHKVNVSPAEPRTNSEALKKKWEDPTFREKMSKRKTCKGCHRISPKRGPMSDEVKKRISEAKKGKVSYTRTAEHREKMSALKWWNNGTVSKRSVECPGADFVLGRI